MSLAAGLTDERERLILEHLPLVDAIAGRFARSGERREDLVQVGALALVRAVDRRDPRRTAELPGYLARCVDGEIRRHLRDRVAAVRLPRRVQEAERRQRLARRELTASLGRDPSADEVARAAGLAPDELPPGERAETARRPLELREGDAADARDELEEPLLARALVARAVRELDARERRIVLLRFFLDCSQAEVGEALGLSQAHVSRLLDRSLAKMRRSLLPEAPLSAVPGGATLGGDGSGSEGRGSPAVPPVGRPARR